MTAMAAGALIVVADSRVIIEHVVPTKLVRLQTVHLVQKTPC
jgi:hypothetical protein